MDEQEAWAICFANLKGAKDKDLIGTARALQYLKGLPKYGSNAKLGRDLGVSGETVREFLSLLKLPDMIRHLFEQKQLSSLEQGRRLWQLARAKPELLEETTQAICNLTAHDGRYIVEYILRNPGVSVSEAKRTVIESKTITEKEFHIIALLQEEEYRLLADEARKRKVAVDVLVSLIVQRWLESQGYDT